jgi:hypothetical protein
LAIPRACGRCNRKALKIAQERVFGTNATMYLVKCTNPACKLRTWATDTEEKAVKKWNEGKVYQAIL